MLPILYEARFRCIKHPLDSTWPIQQECLYSYKYTWFHSFNGLDVFVIMTPLRLEDTWPIDPLNKSQESLRNLRYDAYL